MQPGRVLRTLASFFLETGSERVPQSEKELASLLPLEFIVGVGLLGAGIHRVNLLRSEWADCTVHDVVFTALVHSPPTGQHFIAVHTWCETL